MYHVRGPVQCRARQYFRAIVPGRGPIWLAPIPGERGRAGCRAPVSATNRNRGAFMFDSERAAPGGGRQARV